MDTTIKIISCCEKETPAILGISVNIFKLSLRRAAGKELLKSEEKKNEGNSEYTYRYTPCYWVLLLLLLACKTSLTFQRDLDLKQLIFLPAN